MNGMSQNFLDQFVNFKRESPMILLTETLSIDDPREWTAALHTDKQKEVKVLNDEKAFEVIHKT